MRPTEESQHHVMFVATALVMGHGEADVNVLLIRESDGRYRKATGTDLSRLAEAYPKFIKAVNAFNASE